MRFRHTGINNQIFHLNPRLSYDSSEEPPVLRLRRKCRVGFRPICPRLTIIRSDSTAVVATDRAFGFYN
jgi:hypothetical protein